jgi:hypothetical protein
MPSSAGSRTESTVPSMKARPRHRQRRQYQAALWNDDAQLVLGDSKVAEYLGTLGCVHWVAHHGVNRPAAIGEAAGSTCVRAVTPPLGRDQRLEADERRVRDGPL